MTKTTALTSKCIVSLKFKCIVQLKIHSSVLCKFRFNKVNLNFVHISKTKIRPKK